MATESGREEVAAASATSSSKPVPVMKFLHDFSDSVSSPTSLPPDFYFFVHTLLATCLGKRRKRKEWRRCRRLGDLALSG